MNPLYPAKRLAGGRHDDDRMLTREEPLARDADAIAAAPVIIEARGVEKTFRIPQNKVDSLKERVTNPLRRRDYRELHALRGVSFDVHQGEFFGIVGRNGSGKSTLLKIMSSIYRADAGRIRIGGRLAPFIELGVGFNPELTSRENVVLNGVLMGLTKREAQARLDAVLDFAELREFADLKLKNYSSGMMVRLAFAVMVEADADLMLIDEVLAVGDAAFGQKCMDFFREKRDQGRTVVLVTHDMTTVQAFCDRAMLIHDGELRYIGDPEEAALQYYRLNFAPEEIELREPRILPDVNARVIDAWLSDERGERIDNPEQGRPLGLNVIIEARHELVTPGFTFDFHGADGATVFGISTAFDEERVEAGQRVRISATIQNPLLPGRYFVNCWVSRNRSPLDVAMHALRLLDFVVYGTKPGPGTVSVDADISASIMDER